MRNGDFLFSFLNQELILTPEKALFWAENNTLVLSDVHLGKSGHFRKAGIAVPTNVNENNLERLNTLIAHFSPNRILFLGDLFHSDKNSEWESFRKWRNRNLHIEMHLTIGNHDFHSVKEYESIGLICSHCIEFIPFLFLHDFSEINEINDSYPISGHVHPSVKLIGKGRQSIRVPCFYFGNEYALLPAFGSFTGTYTIKPKTEELVFGVVNDQIIDIS